jgi:predicted SprT family Zn-dependent metalloprotease
MAFITFDYRCSTCDTHEEKLVLRREMDAQRCDVCKSQLVRLPANPRTHFRFADTKLKD